jgi:putrescine transport system substrate-binding protein
MKRWWLAATAAIGTMAGSALCAQERVVHVYNWSDYITDDALRSFTQETGIRVVYDVYDNNEVLDAKLLAGKSGYDVVFPSARPFAARQIAAGLYLPLDKAKLPNWKHLDPAVLEGLASIDPGNAHAMPYMWGTTGIGYNKAKVAEVMGADFVVDSWSVLFDPAVVGKLASCGVALLDDEVEGLGAALIYLGRHPKSGSAEDLAAVNALYQKVRPSVRYFSSSRYIDDLANGDICVAMGYSGDVLQARDRADEAGNGVEIAFVIPKEGAIRWVDLAAIPKDAKHVTEAHAFLDFLMRPDVIAGITNYVTYANANLASKASVDPEIRDDPGIYPPPEVSAKLVDDTTPKASEQRARVRAWTRVKSGR